MVTLSTSAYFLTCCKPILSSPFTFCIEPPKLINLYFYPDNCLLQVRFFECKSHNKLNDHCLNSFSTCTDSRAWTLDNGQRRQHFLDIVSGRVTLCGNENSGVLQKPKVSEEVDSDDKHVQITHHEIVIVESDVVSVEKRASKEKTPAKDPVEHKDEVVKVPCPPIPPDETRTRPDPDNKDIVLLTDEIVDKLDQNLVNLEVTFDQFVRKNRDFIQNLVGCLDFEKRKEQILENEYNKLKQENENLRTKNEYLNMVNAKQLELFRSELDRLLSENKAVYKRKIHQMDIQLKTDQDELQYYKKNERRYLQVVENENMEIRKLKNDIELLKHKETVLLKHYVDVLKFLEDLKESLINSCEKKEDPLQRSSNTITDSGTNPILTEVLRTALRNGMKGLNVRDLSILHDAIQEKNEHLCHQNDACGKHLLTNMNSSHFSMICREEFEEYPVSDHLQKGIQDYETSSNLSIFPSRQKPDNSYEHFV